VTVPGSEVPDNGGVTTTSPTTPPPAPPGAAGKRRHGRETAADMIRSLGLVMVLVLVLWFFAQPPGSDEASIRVVDPAPDVAAWTAAVAGAPVPVGLPPAWRPTSSRYERGLSG
jgi:hypothetical protein